MEKSRKLVNGTKRSLAILLAFILVSVMAGCSGGEAGSSAGAGSQSAPASNAASEAAPGGESASGDGSTIRFAWWGSDERHMATLAVMERYSELNGVTIEGEYSGWDGYLEKMVTQMSADTAPDIMQIDYAFLEPFWKQMDNFVDFNKDTVVDKSGFGQSMLDGITASTGELIGLPTGQNFSMLYASQEAADKYGIDLSQQFTWDLLVQEGQKVNQQDPEAYFILPFAVNRFIFEPHLVNQSGKKMVEDDYTVGFTREQLVNTYTYINELYAKKVMQPYEDVVEVKVGYESPKWINGQAVVFGDWAAAFEAVKTSKGDDLRCLPPAGDHNAANTGIVLRPTNMLSVNAKSAKKEEALKFVDYFFNDDESIDTLKLVRAMPATTKALDRMTQQGLINEGLKSVADWCVNHKGGAGQNIITTNLEIDTIVNDTLASLYYGDLTPETAADQFMQLMTDKVAELKEISMRN